MLASFAAFVHNRLNPLSVEDLFSVVTMKMKSCLSGAALGVVLSIFNAQMSTSLAQGTTFTYQGRLNLGSSAYTGVAEIQATLWDAVSGGNQLAANSPASVFVNVTNGLFVLPLNFGSSPFSAGADRWLEIQVRTTLEPFTTLTPRQKLTPTPYAIRAASAATAASASSVAAENIVGTLGLAQLPGTVLTNNYTGVNLSGTFAGDGGGLSNVPAASLAISTTNVSITSWGQNDRGQRTIPASLDGAHVIAVAAGYYHSLALKGDGTVVAWGAGQTNDPAFHFSEVGQSIVPTGLDNVTAISAGYLHSLALRADRTVIAWGLNDVGQTDVPVTVNNIIAISAGAYHNLALKADGTVVAWGTNSHGQMSVPLGLNNVVAVSAGVMHSLALKADGTVVIWGANDYGQTNPPAGLSNITAIAAGGVHTLALKADGTVLAWGAGQTNDPINGHYGQSIVPAGLSNVVAIAAGIYHSLALKADSTVVGWGAAEAAATVPPGLNNVVGLARGSLALHALALRKRFVGPVAWLDSDNTFTGSIRVQGDGHFEGEMSAIGLRLNDGHLWLRGGNDRRNGLAWYDSFGGVQRDGPVLFGAGGGVLGTVGTNGRKAALSWDSSERVRIGGLAAPQLSLGGYPNYSKLLLYDVGGRGVGLGGNSGGLIFHLNDAGRFSFMSSSQGGEVFTIVTTSNSIGSVGIGTTDPTSKLDVRGDIRFGNSGQFNVPGGQERLRIIRGTISSAGAILAGEGFTASRSSTGIYTVTFTASFPTVPSVTATAQASVPCLVTCPAVAAGSAQFRTYNGSTLLDVQFSFIAIGPR